MTLKEEKEEVKRCTKMMRPETAGKTLPANKATLLEEFVSYLDVKPASAKTYTKAIKQFFNYLSDQKITNPTRDDVIAWREELKENHSASTVQTYIISLRRFFRWTESAGYYSNVAQDVKGAKVSKLHKRDYLTADQCSDFISGLPRSTQEEKRNYAIIVLMTTCGLRDIEVSRAKVGDLSLKAGKTVLYIQGKGKDEKGDVIIVPPLAEKAIRDYLSTREGISAASPLFASLSRRNAGKSIATRTVSGVVKTALRKAGFNSKRLTAHSMRHTAATLALLNGCDIRQVQQFLRHASINTTQIYAHDLDAINNKCSNVIASVIV